MRIPINTTSDGYAFAVKANYFKNASLSTLVNGGGISLVREFSKSAKILPVGKVWKSENNGWCYSTSGLCPTICIGAHGGCQPKVIWYEED
jgi:hypothetical protein